jgi:hypothetical protein
VSPARSTVKGTGDEAVVALPSSLGAAWREGTELSWTPFPPDGGLLLRGGARLDGVLLASVNTLPLDELFGLLVSGMRTGKLVFARGPVRKTVSLKDGQVVFATSTEPWERVGVKLVELGLLTKDALLRALKDVRPGIRLGQVLHRTGLLTQPQLYSAMTFLCREIVVNLLCEASGHALFLENAPLPEDVLRLPDPTRDLVLEGVKRAEEVRRLRRRFPANLRVARAAAPRPDGAWGEVWDRAEQPVELSALRAGFEGPEHAFLSAVEGLLGTGALGLRPRTEEEAQPAPPAHVAGPPTLEPFAALVQNICQALRDAGQGLEDLRSFLADPLPGMEAALAGVTLSDEGRLDLARLAQNAGGEEAEARAGAYEVLHAFVSYALFSARNVLPAEVAEGLQRAFRKMQEGNPP